MLLLSLLACIDARSLYEQRLAELTDDDGDGFNDDEDDCDDTDDAIHPGADEVPYDGIDNDCSEGDDDDLDGDGYASIVVGGDDCDDGDDTTHLGAAETGTQLSPRDYFRSQPHR